MKRFSVALLLCLAACKGSSDVGQESITIDGQDLTLTTTYMESPARNYLGMTSTFHAEAYGTSPLYVLNFTGSQRLFSSVNQESFVAHVKQYGEGKMQTLCGATGFSQAIQPELIGDATPVDPTGTFDFVLVSNRPNQVILRMRCGS